VSPDLPRAHCAVCGESGLEPFLEIPACPVFQGCVPFERGAAGLRALCPDTRIVSLASLEDAPARVTASCH